VPARADDTLVGDFRGSVAHGTSPSQHVGMFTPICGERGVDRPPLLDDRYDSIARGCGVVDGLLSASPANADHGAGFQRPRLRIARRFDPAAANRAALHREHVWWNPRVGGAIAHRHGIIHLSVTLANENRTKLLHLSEAGADFRVDYPQWGETHPSKRNTCNVETAVVCLERR